MITDLQTYEQLVTEIIPTEINSQEDATKVQNVLQLRALLIERVTMIRKCKGSAQRSAATLAQIDEEFERDDLKDWSIMDLEGRRTIELANIEHCKLMTQQHWLEMAAYKGMLKED